MTAVVEGSVGGPVDVAVISKGDGFVWIKRKNYFRPELNPHFFDNSLNNLYDSFSFNPDCPPSISKDRDVLSIFKNRSEKPDQIVQGMLPKEISEVVSNKVIAVVRKLFENTKKIYREKESNQNSH